MDRAYPAAAITHNAMYVLYYSVYCCISAVVYFG